MRLSRKQQGRVWRDVKRRGLESVKSAVESLVHGLEVKDSLEEPSKVRRGGEMGPLLRKNVL